MTTKRTETARTTDAGQTFAVVGDIYRFLATGEDTALEQFAAIAEKVNATENRRESTAT